ncbi:hypothetical protein [Sphingobium sp.]|uniref:hypothetical protein n=1 Tax=Sphingobium sp. TaxID=1912891 RepID=UPI002579810B|nr:hypothetical protein [Sphingobium sp.]
MPAAALMQVRDPSNGMTEPFDHAAFAQMMSAPSRRRSLHLVVNADRIFYNLLDDYFRSVS